MPTGYTAKEARKGVTYTMVNSYLPGIYLLVMIAIGLFLLALMEYTTTRRTKRTRRLNKHLRRYRCPLCKTLHYV